MRYDMQTGRSSFSSHSPKKRVPTENVFFFATRPDRKKI